MCESYCKTVQNLLSIGVKSSTDALPPLSTWKNSFVSSRTRASRTTLADQVHSTAVPEKSTISSLVTPKNAITEKHVCPVANKRIARVRGHGTVVQQPVRLLLLPLLHTPRCKLTVYRFDCRCNQQLIAPPSMAGSPVCYNHPRALHRATIDRASANCTANCTESTSNSTTYILTTPQSPLCDYATRENSRPPIQPLITSSCAVIPTYSYGKAVTFRGNIQTRHIFGAVFLAKANAMRAPPNEHAQVNDLIPIRFVYTVLIHTAKHKPCTG